MPRLLATAYIAALFTSIFLLTFHANMLKGFNHDEHMYVAGGALLAREGLLPYRDFPYFQMPNLPLLYAPLFLLGTDLLFTARLFSTLCALGVAAVLFWTGWRVASPYSTPIRLLTGTCATLLLLANPVYFYASGIAWNHDPSIMFALFGFILYTEGIRRDTSRLLTSAGALLGLAIGTRLTFIFALISLLLLLFTLPASYPLKRKAIFGSALIAGSAAALLPSLVLFALSPGRVQKDKLGNHIFNEQN
jgi:hypothetical protein